MDEDVGSIVNEIGAVEIVLSLNEVEDYARYDRKGKQQDPDEKTAVGFSQKHHVTVLMLQLLVMFLV